MSARAGMGFKLFSPYPQQQAFIDLTRDVDNLCLSGANRTGKTSLMGKYLLPVWATGDYPDDWTGRRFDGPIVAWCGSTDWSTNIVGCQLALLGPVHEDQSKAGQSYWDKATKSWQPAGIPADRIAKIVMNPQVKGAVSRVFVRHNDGGTSEIRFISYLQGRERLQAGKIDIAWCDEEPPLDVNTELAARTIDSAGLSILTFTPLKGISEVVKGFLGETQIDENMAKVVRSSVGALVRMAAEDVPHLGPEKIAAMKRRYPKHEWPARIDGIPVLGEGAIYPYSREDLEVDGFKPPKHWIVCDAIDFGYQHPTARVRAYMNPDTKQIYITQVYKDNLKSATQHAAEWERQFKWRVPVAYPHDGANTETDGRTKADKYRKAGVLLLSGPVQMPAQKGPVMSLEGSIQLVDDMMREGTLKLFKGLTHLWSEIPLYRREKKKNATVATIVKENDDALDAMRYVIMALLTGCGAIIDTAQQERDVLESRAARSAGYADFDPFEM